MDYQIHTYMTKTGFLCGSIEPVITIQYEAVATSIPRYWFIVDGDWFSVTPNSHSDTAAMEG